jgi:hypothetical protein
MSTELTWLVSGQCLPALSSQRPSFYLLRALSLSLPYAAAPSFIYYRHSVCLCLTQQHPLLFIRGTQFVSALHSSTLFYLLQALSLSLPYTAVPSFIY